MGTREVKQGMIDSLFETASEQLSDFVSEELGPLVEEITFVLLNMNPQKPFEGDGEREVLLYYATYHSVLVKLLSQFIDRQYAAKV